MTYFQMDRSAAYEVRVRSLFMGVFTWMFLGLLLTTAVAVVVASTSLIDLLGNPFIYFGAIIAEFGLVIWLSARINKLSTTAAATLFLVYAAVNGFTLSLVVATNSTATLGTAFLSSAGVFGSMVVIGATTKMNLSGMRTYLLMGLIGIIIASIVNMFLGNNTLDWIISIGGVLIFTGLTAYDAQRIQRLANQFDGNSNVAVIGALWLYLDFINLFLYILKILNKRR